MTRRNFNTIERCAILILDKLAREGRPIPFALQKKLSAAELVSWFDADHWPTRHELGGTTHPSNGQMLLNRKGARRLGWILGLAQLDEHGHKTNTIDKPAIAKSRRIVAKREDIEDNRRRMLAKGEPVDYAHKEERAKPKRKMRGQGFRKRPEGAKYNWAKGGRLERMDK